MSELVNNITKFISTATNFIFIKHPMRTSLGVVLGIALSTIVKVFNPAISTFSPAIDISKVKIWEYVFLGVVILHFQTILFLLSKRSDIFSENEERIFEMFRMAKTMGVPEWQIHKMYLELYEKVLENVELKEPMKDEIRKQNGNA